MSREAWYFALGGAFALHNLEEALNAVRLVELLQTRAPAWLQSEFSQVDASEFRTGLLVVTALGILLASMAARKPRSGKWSYAMIVFGVVLGLNTLSHIALSFTFRTYMPGSLTALTLTLPLSLGLVRGAWREQWIASGLLWTVAPVALVIHGPVLIGFVRIISHL